MIPLAPALVVAAANAFVGVEEEGGNNRGQMVEVFLRSVGLEEGEPWCAAFVHHVGKAALYDARIERSSWPLPATASCTVLAGHARANGLDRTDPMAGDVFVQYRKELKRYGHTGIVIGVEKCTIGKQGFAEWVVTTIEGNTNDAGSREGDSVMRKTRRLCPFAGDIFIRWVDMELRQQRAA